MHVTVDHGANLLTVHLIVKAVAPNEAFVLDVRCLHQIGSFTTDASGRGEVTVTYPLTGGAFGAVPGTFDIDIFAPPLVNSYVAGTFTN
jgi:hypothetical protein